MVKKCEKKNCQCPKTSLYSKQPVWNVTYLDQGSGMSRLKYVTVESFCQIGYARAIVRLLCHLTVKPGLAIQAGMDHVTSRLSTL